MFDYSLGPSLSKPQVTISPAALEVDEYSSDYSRCIVTGNPRPEIVWERLDGSFSSNVYASGEYLRFDSIEKSDEGNYRCYAKNSMGDHDQILQVYVRSRNVPTRPPAVFESVEISPPSFDGRTGDEVKLSCSAQPRGDVSWTKNGKPIYSRNVFINGEELFIRQATPEDSGRFVCTAVFPSGATKVASADVSFGPVYNE
jgi:Immunoglobulin domain